MAKLFNLNLSRINNNMLLSRDSGYDSLSPPKKMAFRVRSSKFRHVFGSPAKKEHCFEGVKITKNAHDSNFCAVNPRFIALVTESAGGGTFLVLPLDKIGRVDINSPKVCGHTGPVLDIKWNPFNDHQIASSSDDATVKIWQVTEGGLKGNLTEWLVDLHGHQRRVGYIEWHPTAENILLSAGFDFKVILWNTETAEPINIISVHDDTIFSIAWNRDGSLFATTCKDKKIRIIEPREGKVIAEGQGHQGSKASKVVFVDKTKLFTTGFSRISERQYAVWDSNNLTKPLKMDNIDSSSGVMIPFFDSDTQVVFLAGKGDGNIRYYEIVNDPPYVHFLSQYQSGSPQRGLGVMPKRGINPAKCEIMRFYKLHTVKGLCEPISMIVPRKSEMFQEDIFPPTASSCPSLTTDEWISGQNREPILISLKDGHICPVPKGYAGKAVKSKVNMVSSHSSPAISNKEPRKAGDSSRHKSSESIRTSSNNKTSTSKTNKSNKMPPKSVPKPKAIPVRCGRVSEIRRQFSKKDGVISHTPTITTYKAVKRGASNSEFSSSNKRTASPSSGRTVSAPEKMPASVKNIKKLSTDLNEDMMENNNVSCDVSDRISIFETKRSMTTTEPVTRMTNANEPLRVDKKVWTSAYTNAAVSNEVPTINGTPKTDPELHMMGTSTGRPAGVPSGERQQNKTPWEQDELPSGERQQNKAHWEQEDLYYSPPETQESSAFSNIGSGRRATSFRGETRQASAELKPELFRRKGSLKEVRSRKSQEITNSTTQRDSRSSVRSTDSFYSTDNYGPNDSTLNESFGTNESLASEGSEKFTTPPSSPIKPPQPSSAEQEQTFPSAQYEQDFEVDDDWNNNPLYSRGKYRKPTRRRQRDAGPLRSNTTDAIIQNIPVDTTPLDDILNDFKASSRALDERRGIRTPQTPTSGAIIQNIRKSTNQNSKQELRGISQAKIDMQQPVPSKDTYSPYSDQDQQNGAFKPSQDDFLLNEQTSQVPPSNSDPVLILGGGNVNNEAIIDCISTEAPDNTLIKPSKLRASMRSRKDRHSLRGSSGEEPGLGPAGSSPGYSRPSPDQIRSSTRGSLSPDLGLYMGSQDNQSPYKRSLNVLSTDSGRPQSFVQNGDEFIFKSTLSPFARSNSVPDHKFKYNSGSEINNNNNGKDLKKSSDPDLSSAPMQRQGSFRSSANLILSNSSSPRSARSSASTDDVSTRSPATKFGFHSSATSASSPSDKNLNLWDMDAHADHQPVIMRQGSVSRTRGSAKKLKALLQDEDYSKVHIKKVWSPQSPPPAFDTGLENGVPLTDPELRKAYFRQLEEINSLKDQLSLKDKRIRQLEEELRLLRPVVSQNEIGESTC